LRAQLLGSYQYLTGNIGSFPVAMHLHKAGHYYSGYYYYTKTEQPVYITGNDTAAGDGKIRLLAFVPGEDNNEVFTLQLKEDSYTGEWQKRPDSNPLKVALSNKAGPPLSFQYVFTSGAVALRPSMKASPSASFDAGAVWPKEQSPLAAAIKAAIRKCFTEKNSDAPIGKIFPEQKKEFLESYINDNKNVADSEIVDFPAGFTLEESRYAGICYQSAALLGLYYFSYSYAGGAHGNYSTSYIPVNLLTGKVMQLQDVVLPAGKRKLNMLLEKYFRKSRGLNPGDALSEKGGLFENKIEAGDNFYLTGKGITFSYTPYEIAPYAAGEIQVFIPYTDMKDLLQPGMKKILTGY
jgi:hypothetical protein